MIRNTICAVFILCAFSAVRGQDAPDSPGNGSVASARSLDAIDRESFRAGPSPMEIQGVRMTEIGVRSAGKPRPPRELSLGGTWRMVEATGDAPDWEASVPAEVPGSVHAALLAANRIPAPTVGMNDSIAEKYSYKGWWFKRDFRYDGGWENVQLSFGGVANKCTVYLNGQELGKHEGMFGGPDFMLTDLLRKGENELAVYLEPIPYFGPEASPFATSWISTVVANCVYGWHYAKIPTLGIWQDVKLKEVPDRHFEHPCVFTRDTDGSMRLLVTLPEKTERGKLRLVVAPKNFEGKSQAYQYDIAGKSGTLALDFEIDDPRLWWPNDYGEQALYTATVSLDAGGTRDVQSLTFGIRTIEMRPLPSGEREDLYNWTFVINGRPIFMKGANWCLMDVMMDLSPERYARFLGAAKDQHLNLLRAWGGGLSETDTFYDMCDEMGLMVMQEWPTCWNSHNTQNLDVMRETVVRNTLRIRTHPSLALWAGGNESSEPFGEMIDMMGRAAIELDGTRAFHRGEPWGGSKHNHDSWWLDLHLNNALNMQTIFWGEFGMPSLPVKESMERYMDGEPFSYPLSPNSVFEHHAPTFGAWQDMKRLFREVSFFVEPTSLDNVILGSQLAQTVGTRRALERARTLWPDHSTGALYYKVNDVYPGLSWGSIDYYGAKKATHYFVKRSLAPCVPVILFDRTNLTRQEVELPYFLLDDTLSLAGRNVTLHLSVYDLGMRKVYERTDEISPDASVERLPDIRLDSEQTTSPLLYFKTDIRDESGCLIKRNWYIENFDSKQGAIFESPRCPLAVVQDRNTVRITNTSDAVPAVAVSIEVPGEADRLDLSDNHLWIDPGETLVVEMNTESPATVTSWNLAQ